MTLSDGNIFHVTPRDMRSLVYGTSLLPGAFHRDTPCVPLEKVRRKFPRLRSRMIITVTWETGRLQSPRRAKVEGSPGESALAAPDSCARKNIPAPSLKVLSRIKRSFPLRFPRPIHIHCVGKIFTDRNDQSSFN